MNCAYFYCFFTFRNCYLLPSPETTTPSLRNSRCFFSSRLVFEKFFVCCENTAFKRAHAQILAERVSRKRVSRGWGSERELRESIERDIAESEDTHSRERESHSRERDAAERDERTAQRTNTHAHRHIDAHIRATHTISLSHAITKLHNRERDTAERVSRERNCESYRRDRDSRRKGKQRTTLEMSTAHLPDVL